MTLLVAVLLCVASSVAYAAGALLQRHFAGVRLGALAAQPWWWVALLLNAAGAILHVAALRFGPLLLVQPFGLLTLVLAVLFTAARTHRPVGPVQRKGLVLTCAGLAGLLVLMDSGAARAIEPGQLVVLLAAVIAALAVAAAISRIRGAASLAAATAAGISFGVASALTQTVTVVVSESGAAAYGAGWLALAATGIAVLAGAGTLFTQVSYRRTFSAALATSTLVNPLVAAMIGIGLLGEHLRWGPAGVVGGLICAVLAGWGIAILTGHPDGAADEAETARPPRRPPAHVRHRSHVS